MTTQQAPNQPHIEIFSLADELARFRAHLEQEADVPISELEVNAALLLLDLCTFLRLGSSQSKRILGNTTVTKIYAFMMTTVTTAIKH